MSFEELLALLEAYLRHVENMEHLGLQEAGINKVSLCTYSRELISVFASR